MFSLVAPHEITLFFIVTIVINGLIGIVILPHHMAIGGSGKTEISCRTGWTYGNFLKRFATMGWAFIGVFAAFLYPVLGFQERELAFGIAAKNLLPVGIFVMVVVSYFTKSEPEKQLHKFYTLLDTPSAKNNDSKIKTSRTSSEDNPREKFQKR